MPTPEPHIIIVPKVLCAALMAYARHKLPPIADAAGGNGPAYNPVATQDIPGEGNLQAAYQAEGGYQDTEAVRY